MKILSKEELLAVLDLRYWLETAEELLTNDLHEQDFIDTDTLEAAIGKIKESVDDYYNSEKSDLFDTLVKPGEIILVIVSDAIANWSYTYIRINGIKPDSYGLPSVEYDSLDVASGFVKGIKFQEACSLPSEEFSDIFLSNKKLDTKKTQEELQKDWDKYMAILASMDNE